MKKKTMEEYLNELKSRGITSVPTEEYLGYDTPISHRCTFGHVTKRSPNNVLRKSKCTICANNIKCDTNLYLEKLLQKNIDIVPIEEYINTDTAIQHKCINGHIWKQEPKNVLSGRKCPKCSINLGYYSESFFKNSEEACKLPGILYCVVLVDKKTSERVCIKIGITKGTSNKDVLQRVKHFTGYEARIQKLVFGTLEEVFYLEQYLHELWSEKKYTSKWKFGGYSELFELSDEIIKSIPNKC